MLVTKSSSRFLCWRPSSFRFLRKSFLFFSPDHRLVCVCKCLNVNPDATLIASHSGMQMPPVREQQGCGPVLLVMQITLGKTLPFSADLMFITRACVPPKSAERSSLWGFCRVSVFGVTLRNICLALDASCEIEWILATQFNA